MSLPTKSDVLTMNYAWRGQPFVAVAAKAPSTTTLDFAYHAQPFVGIAGAPAIAAALAGKGVVIGAGVF